MHAPSIAALPTWTIFASGMFGISPMRRDASTLEMPAEPAGEVEDVDVVEADAVVVEDDLQAGDVRALGLGQLVHVAFEEEDVVLLVEHDARCRASSNRPILVHPPGAEQLAHQIDQARAADALRRDVADDAELERRRRRRSRRLRSRRRAPACRRRSRRLRTPGPAGQDAARMRCLLPRISSVFVPMSMIATSRSSCARSIASMHAAASAPRWPLMIGAAVDAGLGMDREQRLLAR